MKPLCTTLALGALILSSFSAAAYDATWLQQEKTKLHPGVALLVGALEMCVKTQLGGNEERMQNVYRLAESAQAEITQSCQEHDNNKARGIASAYARTPEGQAVLNCLAELRPFAEQPNIQQALGKQRDAVNSLVNKRIPSKICL